MESKEERKSALESWLAKHFGHQTISLQTIVPDASFRRYFRIYSSEGSFIAMDAPLHSENCGSFIAIANALRKLGLKTPEIIHQDVENGFLLISDFGDLSYLKILNEQNVAILYGKALEALSVLQTCSEVEGYQLPSFSAELMWQEWAWHKEWFAQKLLNIQANELPTSLERCFSFVVESALIQPQVFMHRDYHCANLMALPNTEVGLLDFQDAFIGPVTYDLVSLLRDCYIDWPESIVSFWALNYQKQLKKLGVLPYTSEDEFLRWFDLMGVERHLKALFTFARKEVRDQQSHYLKHIPRTLRYLEQASAKYTELAALHEYVTQLALPAWAKRNATCVP